MDDGKAHFETLVVDDEPTEGVVGTSEALCALAPVGLLAELTHRCPLQCSYCSNPLELERVNKELTTEEWCSAMTQAGEMGILQVHLSGGEPTARKDLEQIVEAAAKAGLYTNLITAAVTLNRPRLEGLQKLGLDHVRFLPGRGRGECRQRLSQGLKRSRRRLSHRVCRHHQRADSSAQHPQRAALHRACGEARRPAARNRPCPILRLGLSQPRGADPDL
jgi:hypothetical protein